MATRFWFFCTTTIRRPAVQIALSACSAAAGILLLLTCSGPTPAAALGLVVLLASAAAIACHAAAARKRPSSDSVSKAMADAERLAGLGSVAAAVAHEIRNPLSALDIHAQLLEEILPQNESAAEARKRLDIIRAETHRLNLIVENFIRFARLNVLHASPVQMPAHLANVLRLIQSEADDRGVAIDKTGLRTNLPEVMADPNQLEQAFLNIVINALQSMPHGGRLSLAARVHAGYVECIIANNGPQIPPDELSKIFELFYTTKEHGSGLGLPIAQKILSEHNGYITVESDPAQTAFSLGVPVLTKNAPTLHNTGS